MCIIAAKPAGVKMPDEATITRMWYRNPDGAGIMYVADGKVRIDKGFMKLTDLKAHLEKVRQRVDLDATSVVMHFRITTHGGTCPANCHPFPITRSVKALQTLHQSAPIGIAHNGVIPITPRKGISDTMEYIATQLAPLYDMKRDFVKDKNAMELVRNAIGSKMAFLTASNEIYLIGEFTEHEGIKYSNSSYEEYRFPSYTSYAYGYGGWSSYDFDGYDKAGNQEIPLMWAEFAPDGAYAKDDDTGDMFDDLCELLIDEEGRTYIYDWGDGLAYPAPEIHVYLQNGSPIIFNPDEALLESVGETYDDLYRVTKQIKRKKKKSKKNSKEVAAKAAAALDGGKAPF